MASNRRRELIRQIENARGSRVITYITTTRDNVPGFMTLDHVRRLWEHLQDVQGEPIDLFLCSKGGEITVPWRLVTLIREYTDTFSVLIPHQALSAATLIALGANRMILHPMAVLSPTDPSFRHPFGPTDEHQNHLPISVEDVASYFALLKEDAGLTHHDELAPLVQVLAERVHPLALGHVKRFLSQSRMLATRLLALHMDATQDSAKIEQIVNNLIQNLYFHEHPINRHEVLNYLGISTVEFPNKALEALMWELYCDYEADLQLDRPFDPYLEIHHRSPDAAAGATDASEVRELPLVYIESRQRTDALTVQYRIVMTQPQSPQTLWMARQWHTT
jgi:hypothetical protein